MKKKLSVAMICFNEEKRLAKTLEAIKNIADELVIVDNGSTDKTLEIAASFGAKIFHEDWKGHVAQKNSALAKCTCDWILALDADEVVTAELNIEISNAIKNANYVGYSFKRKTYLFGKFLEYAWQPDRKLRLVQKNANPVWKGVDPHDVLTVNGKTKNLANFVEHYSYKNMADHLTKTIKYAQTSAFEYHKSGKKFKLTSLLFNPPFKFFKEYFLKNGFLDGVRGFYAAFGALIYTYIKYFHLWELEQKNCEK